MNNNENRNFFKSLSWQWTLVSYCFLVLFHLLPTCTLLSPRILDLDRLLDFFLVFQGKEFVQLAVWFGIGMVCVGTYVGFRSLGPKILEPAIAGAAYCLTIMMFLQPPSDVPLYYSRPGFVAAMCIFSFVIGFASAGFAALLRLRNESRVPA